MPRGDCTGPWGRGPMTGRGAGFCGYEGGGRPWGFRGPGRGWRQGYYAGGWAAPTSWAPQNAWGKETEKQFHREQISQLENQLEDLKKRLAELEKEE